MLKYRKICIIEHYSIVQMTAVLLIHEAWGSLAADLYFLRVTSAVSAS